MWFVFILFYLFIFVNNKKKIEQLKNRSCSFNPNVIKLIGYVLEPDYYIITKRYQLDLFHFIHHPTEELHPLLALKLAKFFFFFFEVILPIKS